MNLLEPSFHRKNRIHCRDGQRTLDRCDPHRHRAPFRRKCRTHSSSQKEKGKRFGDAAIELGLLGEDDIRFALSSQFDYPYLPAGDNSLSPELVAAYKPFSRSLNSCVPCAANSCCAGSTLKRDARPLAIVSPGNGEGRSFIAANLAVVFSQLGERTLLIDADLRTPRQHELFRLGHSAGLSGLMAGRANTEAVVRVPSLLGLSVLPAGAVPPNPQELLGRPAFLELLQSISSEYDVVIIDTPAASKYADAQTIAVRAGAALILTRKNRSSIPDIVQLSQTLQQSGATLVGSMLNDV